VSTNWLCEERIPASVKIAATFVLVAPPGIFTVVSFIAVDEVAGDGDETVGACTVVDNVGTVAAFTLGGGCVPEEAAIVCT
ncbi:hypothetical protein MXD81_10095, partial [Microbacteriaceae bacterium K1510]|nr:hypothetical protein [Microbacteriaceae bacterium K1510]